MKLKIYPQIKIKKKETKPKRKIWDGQPPPRSTIGGGRTTPMTMGVAEPPLRVLLVVQQLPLVDGGDSNPKNQLLGVAEPVVSTKGHSKTTPKAAPTLNLFSFFFNFLI